MAVMNVCCLRLVETRFHKKKELYEPAKIGANIGADHVNLIFWEVALSA